MPNSNPWRRARPGDPLEIPAAAYNAMLEAAAAERARRQTLGREPSVLTPEGAVVLVKNTSGGNLDRFSVLGIGNALITPTDNADGFKERVALVGVTPAATHAGKFVILLEPLANNAVGRAMAAGVTVAKLNVVDADDAAADAEAGVTATLKTHATTGAATILWKESGTGTKWAVVRFGGAGFTLPTPQYPGMALRSVAQGVWSASWDFLVPAIPLE